MEEDQDDLVVTSEAFQDGQVIPDKYGCKGDNVNPSLKIDDIPEKTASLVIIMDDPDAPVGTFTHWVVWNVEPKGFISENSSPGLEGTNDFNKKGYGGPCPPVGTHRYFFRIYALDRKLQIEEGAPRDLIEKRMQGCIIAQGQLMGKYSR